MTVPPVEQPLIFKQIIYIYPFTSLFFFAFVEHILEKNVKIFGNVVNFGWFILPFSMVLAVLVFFRKKSDFKARPRKVSLLFSLKNFFKKFFV